MRRPREALLILAASTALLAGAACSRPGAPAEAPTAMGTITGTVTYLKRVAVATDAEFTIELRETGTAGTPGRVATRTTVPAEGRDTPVPFILLYDPADVKPGVDHELFAEIHGAGGIRLVTTQPPAVLTSDGPVDGIELILRPAPSAAAAD